MLGMSQRAMGELLGVTFQQVQKYESGANRIAVATLVRAAEALGSPLSFFLEGLGPGEIGGQRKMHKRHPRLSPEFFEAIEDRKLRAALRTIVRALVAHADR
ncbi:helix-turn-helix transcriptional regulator [Aminobacter aganoensis]